MRGWVVEVDVDPEVDARLLPIAAVVSDGPAPDVVALSAWIATRWCGPRVAVLRSASPPNNVRPQPHPNRRQLAPLSGANRRRFEVGRCVRRVPPLHDRRDLVESLLAPAGSTIVCVADGSRAAASRGRSPDAVTAVALAAFGRAALRRAPTRGGARPRASVVVVGGRVAALAPVPDLAAAIVVDDADEALQEERVPTWHARDVLLERARRARCAVDRGVAPHRPSKPKPWSRFAPDAPPPDVEVSGWPRVVVVDRREQPPGARLLTEPLADALRGATGLAVCVLNRRGRFRLLACDACHELLRWDRNAERPLICPSCGEARLRVVRAGVSRVREELAALVPMKTVVDVDADSDDAPVAADIVVGTEAVLAPARDPSPAAHARRVPRSRSRAARAAVPRVGAGALVARARRAAPRRPPARARRGCCCRPACPSTRSCAPSVAGRPEIVTEGEIARRRVLGYPPFGALAELTGEDAALRVAVERCRRSTCRAFGPSDGRVLVHATDWERARVGVARRAARGARPRPHPRRRRPPTCLTPRARGGTAGNPPVPWLRWRPTRSACSAIRCSSVRPRPSTTSTGRTVKLVDAMYETMYDAPGVGLAATQVGVQKRFFVYDIGEGPNVLFNPEVLEATGEWNYEEGCLSLPGLAFEIVRPKVVTVQGIDVDGNAVVVQGDELLGRVFLHEIDHLDGVLMLDRMERSDRKRALRELREQGMGVKTPGGRRHAL